ncbi:MAG TPA: metalloregulator ArsR/SmtB family transcription factor, partial [Planctomycetaceae bacterium]|nr:metalloregulator ArsR/SmtB family transcription factor [Planctomycetaceae bacterium]
PTFDVDFPSCGNRPSIRQVFPRRSGRPGGIAGPRRRDYHRRCCKSVPFCEPVVPTQASVVDQDTFQAQSCADQLKALSEPLRLRIVDVLRHGEMTVGDIAEFLEAEVVTVSHHLGILKHAHLVTVRREGRFMVYSLRKDLLEQASGRAKQFLNLGCCRIEVPETKPE